jgi:hypothetical protein
MTLRSHLCVWACLFLESLLNFYLFSLAFFWGVSATSGIGWNIEPSTPIQVFFSTASIMIGVVLQAVIIGSASSALANFDMLQARKRERMEEINAYLRHRRVPQVTILKPMASQWRECNSNHFHKLFFIYLFLSL